MRDECFKSILLLTLVLASLSTMLALNSKSVQAPLETSAEIFPTDDSHVAEGYPDQVSDGGARYNMYNGWEEAAYLSERIYLKFDLSTVQAETIESATLWLNSKYGPSAGEPDYDSTWHLVDAIGVDGDSWLESEITWNNSPAPVGSVLDTENFQADDFVGSLHWYSWDVTSFVQSEAAGDKIVSICLKGQNEGSKNSAGWFYSKDSGDEYLPYLKISYTTTAEPGVEVSISPTSKSAASGEELTFTVTVTNTGTGADTYALEATDDWVLAISPTSLNLAEGASGTATLSVTVPENAAEGDLTAITVTATSQTDPSVSDTAICTAEWGAAEAFPTIYVIAAVIVIVVIVGAVLIIKPF